MATTRYGTFKVEYYGRSIRLTNFVAQGQKSITKAYAAKDDVFVNTSNGMQYKCATAGYVGKSTWATFTLLDERAPYVKPAAPSSVSISRSGMNLTAKWELPSSWTSNKSAQRATGMIVGWKYGIRSLTDYPTPSTKSHVLTLNRSNWYPLTSNQLTSASFEVYGRNYGGFGSRATASYTFEKPKAPTIDSFAFDTSNGRVSTKIKTDAGSDRKERYDTRYSMNVYNASGQLIETVANTSSTDTTIDLSWDAVGYQGLTYNDYYKIVVQAWARGFAGDSAKVEKTYYVSFPGKVSITDVSVSSKTPEGKATFFIKTNSTKEHPVDVVELEYLADTTYANATDIPGGEEWTQSGITDDANCTALSIACGELLPAAGHYTWVRIKTWHANKDILFRYSTYYRVKQLETPAPTAADETITVISATAVDDTSVLVQLGWNKNGQDDATGTEISWSEHANTWKSTEDPNSYTFTWSDGQYVDGSTTYQDSAAITVKGLTEGVPLYIRARRYLETETATTWSDYSNTFMYIPFGEADNVVAIADQYVARGQSLQVSWSFGSYAYQTEWQIVRTDGLIIAAGTGINTAYEIPADRLAAVSTNGSVTFTVQVSTGSGFLASESHTVNIVDAPTIELTAADITEQPYSFGVACPAEAELKVIVTSMGASGDQALNIGYQPNGDTVHSALYEPEWVNGACTIELPVVDFRDEAKYLLSVTATDSMTGLSTTAEDEVSVAWAHQAPDMTNNVTLTPLDEVDEDGNHLQQVTITLTAPAEAEETDVYNVYRVNGGVATLIGENLPLASEWVDKYAPFGSMAQYYRIATKTADGDTNWLDFDYLLPGNAMRFDWQGGTLELPYNLAIADSYTKDVETRQHLDGSTDAYWNSAVMRNASLSSDVIRLINLEDVDKARALARYPGAVFVRTPDGSAYEADVQVRDMSTTGLIEAVAIDATEINTTGAFMLTEVTNELGS